MNKYEAISKTSAIVVITIVILAILIGIAVYTMRGGGGGTLTTTTSTTTTMSPVIKTTTKTATLKQVFIRFAGWSAGETEMKNYEKIIQQFEKKHPEIVVKYEVITKMYHENILASYGAGVAPDIFYLDSSWASIFIDKGALLPLSDYVSKDFLNQYYDFLLKPFIGKDGKIYGIPKDWSMLMLFYNKKLFQKAGLTEPPKTWDELKKYAEIITNKTGVPGLAIYLKGFNRYVPVALSYGAPDPWFDDPSDASWFDNPAVKETMTWYINLYLEGKIEREKASLTPYVVDPSDINCGWLGDAFGSQKVAMVISGNWMIPFLADQYPDFKYGEDWDIAPVPAGPNGRATMAYTVALAINSKTQHAKEAIEFLKYVTGKEGQKTLVVKMGHTLPSIESLANDPDMWPQHKKSLSFVPKYTKILVFLWGPKSGEIEQKLSEIMASAMRGEISIDEALQYMKQAIQEIYSG